MFKYSIFLLLYVSVAVAQPKPVTSVVHTPDVDLTYEIYGKPSAATPAIIINGGLGLAHDYMLLSDVFTGALAQHRQVVFYDQRGIGKSRIINPSAPLDMAAQVADLEAIRAKLAFQSFDIIGHSWGGTLAMGYAATYPQHIHKFVIIDSGAPHLPITIELFKELYPDQLESEQKEGNADPSDDDPVKSGQFLRRFLRRDFYSQQNFDQYISPVSDFELGKIANWTLSANVEKLVDVIDLSSKLPEFHFPSLVINGRYDINCAVITAWEIYKAIPGAKIAIFEKSGHFPFYEEREPFLQALNSFLADTSERPLGQ